MQLRHFTLCAASLATAASALAAPLASPFAQADSLKQLPPQVQQQLGIGAPGSASTIADHGEPFDAGCIIRDGVPHKRFLVGAVSKDVVVVAIEQGGIAHYSTTFEFHRLGEQWLQSERKGAKRFPRSLQDLLASDQPV